MSVIFPNSSSFFPNVYVGKKIFEELPLFSKIDFNKFCELIQAQLPFEIHAPFVQDFICRDLDEKKCKVLFEYNQRYKGLCELICNRILIDDLLANKDRNAIKNTVTLKRLDEEKIKQSHIMDIYSIFRKIIAWLFGIFPDNILSYLDQWKVINDRTDGEKKIKTINRAVLFPALGNIQEGETLKLEMFRRHGFFQIEGHSCLIKKISENTCTFFDPNFGESEVISFDKLTEIIEIGMQKDNWNDVLFIRGETYLRRIRDRVGDEVMDLPSIA